MEVEDIWEYVANMKESQSVGCSQFGSTTKFREHRDSLLQKTKKHQVKSSSEIFCREFAAKNPRRLHADCFETPCTLMMQGESVFDDFFRANKIQDDMQQLDTQGYSFMIR